MEGLWWLVEGPCCSVAMSSGNEGLAGLQVC